MLFEPGVVPDRVERARGLAAGDARQLRDAAAERGAVTELVDQPRLQVRLCDAAAAGGDDPVGRGEEGGQLSPGA